MTVRQTLRRLHSIARGEKFSYPRILTSERPVTLNSSVPFDLLEIVQRYEVPRTGVLHVGAHHGEEISGYLYHGLTPVMALEPEPDAFSVLAASYSKEPEALLVNAAAGSVKGRAQLNLADNDGQSSSLLEPLLHLHEAPEVRFSGSVFVDVVRLDEILSLQHPYGYWVVDTQGFELEVLRGAGNRLMRVELLLVEVNRAEVYRSAAQIREIDQYLRPFGLDRLLTRWWASWGDALYSRSTLRLRDIP